MLAARALPAAGFSPAVQSRTLHRSSPALIAPRLGRGAQPAAWGGDQQQQFMKGGQQQPMQQQGQSMYPPIYQPGMEPQMQGQQLDERQEDMLRAGTALRNIGWLSFWGQLALTVVSTTILLFSTGVPSSTGIQFSVVDVATMFGIVCGYLSTFLAWSYTRAGMKLGRLQEVKLQSIVGTIVANSNLNLLGMGATIVALQATVGQLVAKTLSSASAGAFYGAGQRAAPPPVAFDVFSVQACTNTIMAHFVAMLFSNWLLMTVNRFLKRAEEREAAGLAEAAPSAPPMPGYTY